MRPFRPIVLVQRVPIVINRRGLGTKSALYDAYLTSPIVPYVRFNWICLTELTKMHILHPHTQNTVILWYVLFTRMARDTSRILREDWQVINVFRKVSDNKLKWQLCKDDETINPCPVQQRTGSYRSPVRSLWLSLYFARVGQGYDKDTKSDVILADINVFTVYWRRVRSGYSFWITNIANRTFGGNNTRSCSLYPRPVPYWFPPALLHMYVFRSRMGDV